MDVRAWKLILKAGKTLAGAQQQFVLGSTGEKMVKLEYIGGSDNGTPGYDSGWLQRERLSRL